jgi:mono/diheme cytochrome c family protein
MLAKLLAIGVLVTTPLSAVRAEEAALRPSEDAVAIDGETMFATACGFCHENGGRSAGKGPKLAGSERSNEYLAERIRKGKPGAMPAFGRVFSETQIMTIVAYIRTLDQ